MSDTSKSELIASDEGQEDPQSDSVYDFLYHDVRRVGSFLSQFDDAGHLQQVVQSEAARLTYRRGFKASAGLNIPGFPAGNIAFERPSGESGSEASERTYDPLWTNARTLLDYLDGRNMIRRDISDARLGQFVLVRGLLLVLDLGMLKNAWGRPSIKKLLQQQMRMEAAKQKSLEDAQQGQGQNRHERRRQAKVASKVNSEPGIDIDLIIDMLSIMPHAIQARIIPDGGLSAWGTLEEQYIVGQASDIVLKHGVVVSGEWVMLGILDALPGDHPDQAAVNAVAEIAGTMVGEAAARFAPATRQALGRPAWSYGLTPLLIFREISA